MTSRIVVDGNGGADPFGVWQTSVGSSVAFNTGSTGSTGPAHPTDVEQSVWRVSLPEDAVESRAFLRDQKTLLAKRRRKMRDARKKLGAEDVATAGISYGTSSWEDTAENARRMLDRASKLVGTSMCVVTTSGDRPIATTRISLAGDLHTVSSASATEDDVAVHRDAVSLATETRLAQWELVAHVLSGAAVLAVKMSLPEGALLALPTAWSYLQRALGATQQVEASRS